MICRKALSIKVTDVAPVCVDWDQLTWGVPVVGGLNPAFNGYTFTPAPTVAAATFHATAYNNDLQFHNLQFQVDAFVSFSSLVACNAEMTLDLSIIYPTDPHAVSGSVKAIRMDTFATLVDSGTLNGSSANHIVLPIAVPAGTYQIRVRVLFGLNDFLDPGAGTIDLEGTFANV